MKEKCSFVRKVALCLMSVAAMGVRAAHVTVDVPRHTTAVWTSGDGSVTNDVTNDGFDVEPGTENVVVTFKPDYTCLKLNVTNCVIKGPINEDVTLYNLPRASVKDIFIDGFPVMTNKYRMARWIKSNGRQIINTGYGQFSTDKVKVDCVVDVPKNQANDNAAVFGLSLTDSDSPQDSQSYAFYAKYGNEDFCAFASGAPDRIGIGFGFPYGRKTYLTCTGDKASWKTTADGAPTGDIDLPGSAKTDPFKGSYSGLHVFARQMTGNTFADKCVDNATMTLYSFRISEKDGGDYKVKYDFVPCVEISNSPLAISERMGLLDLAGNIDRYTNKPYYGPSVYDEEQFEISHLRDDEIAFGIHIPEFDHMTTGWTSGDKAVTNAFPYSFGGEVAIREKTRNLTIVFTPEYGYSLDYGGNPDKGGLIEYPGPLTADFAVDPTLVPRAVRTGHMLTGCGVAHATAAWTRGDGSVTNDIPLTGEILIADGETNIKIIYTPALGWELDKTVCEIAGPFLEDAEIPSRDLPTATMRTDVLPMTNVVKWGTWSANNKTPRAKHGSFIETPGQVMFDTYTERLAENAGDVEAAVHRAFARLKMLAENPGFAKLLKMYGYEFSNDDMHFLGTLTDRMDIMDTPETIRTVCDQCGPLSDVFPVEGIGALKVLEGVVTDLDRVPRGWTGDLVISPNEYPVDDEVLFDYADIQALKAGALEVSSVLNIMKGYNMKLDKASMRKTFGSLDRLQHSDEIGYNGPRRVLESNPEFMDRVLDPDALAHGQIQMQRALIALKEFNDWQKANRDATKWTHEGHYNEREERGYATCHFFEADETRPGWARIMTNFRNYGEEFIKLPYWTIDFNIEAWGAVEYTLTSLEVIKLREKLRWKQYMTFRNIFEGRLTRGHFPVFGGSHTWHLANKYHHHDVGHIAGYELLIDESPDPTIGGLFPSLTRKKLGEFLNQFTTPPEWNRDDTTVTDYFVEYDTGKASFAVSTQNPASIAAGITDPFYLLYPHFNCLELAYWEPGRRWTSSEATIPVPPVPNRNNGDSKTQSEWILFDMTPRYRAVWDADAAFPTDRVGICSQTWCADTETAVEMIVGDGRYKTVQLELAPWVWRGASEASWQHVKEMIASNGLKVASTTLDFPDKGAFWDQGQWAENFNYVTDAAWRTKELGIRRLSAKIDFLADDPDVLYERVKAICDACLWFDADFLIETGSQPSSDLTNLLARLRDEGKVRNVALSFDPCACVLSGAEDPVAAFYALTNEIRQVFLRDCKSDRANGNEDCPWGEGDFSTRTDFGAGTFVETLKTLGFQGDILYKRLSGAATLTQERKRETWDAMSRILDAFGVPVAVLGSPANPWMVGTFVLAYTNGEGVLRLLGGGATEVTPWAGCAAGITEIVKDREVTNIPLVAGTLPDLAMINDLAFSEIQEMGGGTQPVPPEPPAGAVTTWAELTNAVATAESAATGSGGSTVIAVGADIDEPDGELIILEGKSVTIKLYGKTVTCRQVTAKGALSVGDEGDSVGKIVASNGAQIAKRGGSITLLNGPLRGTYTAISPGLAVILR